MSSVKIFFFTALVIVMLAFLCAFFPEDGVAIGGRRFFFPALEEIFESEKSHSAAQKREVYEARIAFQDSLKTAYADSLRFFQDFFENHPARIYFPEGDSIRFDAFFEALDKVAPSRTVHILHYGDSQIESDRITGYFRQQIQQRFGGNGPGLLPVVQPIPSFTIEQSASGSLNRYIISGNHASKAGHNRYGLMGQVTETAGYATVSVQPRKNRDVFENLQTFSRVRLFVSHNSDGFEARLSAGGKTVAKTIKKANETMTTLEWQLPTPVGKITLQTAGHAELTGLSLDSPTGVAVDNIPLRGSSGTFFAEIAPASMQPAMQELNVALIILEFGGNTVPSISGERGVEFYKANIAKQIVFLRKMCPEAVILFIGPSDMSTKVKGKLQTYPMLPQIVEGLKEAALENGAAFWNMFEAMGGENSMLEWVKARPALATPDYIHFTLRGADHIAELLFHSLMVYYDYYSFIQNAPADVQK
jgi:lysophospholipase L1-like esterase